MLSPWTLPISCFGLAWPLHHLPLFYGGALCFFGFELPLNATLLQGILYLFFFISSLSSLFIFFSLLNALWHHDTRCSTVEAERSGFMIDPHSRGDLNCYLDQLVIEEIIMTSARGAITLKRRLPSFMANWTYKLRLLLGDFRWYWSLGLCRFHVVVSRDHYTLLTASGVTALWAQ